MLRLIGTLSPITLALLGAMVAALPLSTGGYFVGKFVGWHAGNAAGKAAIVETVNKRNAEAAKVARGARDDIDRCFNIDGEWLQEAGKCDR
ncbi:hypothetical protein [Methylobacterium sp. ARG-1]|jgi:hypothetical protein|uniref:hypothetical protein n=1 Tax=Methylobacterium sp. ARG-1 TaxID=1692501 RepID=UPI000681167B|nr:hypothetical protein [Methylobacterium sp. ARG-1]KNY21641.1 hypothetical protein AKJ13_15445 [Methylobacterium sp. ARG-1]